MRSLILLATVAALPLAAQQPQLQNGTLTVESSTTPQAELARLQAGSATTWLAYTVPTATRIQQNASDVTYLEGENHGFSANARDTGTPPYRALVLLRISNHALNDIRISNPDHQLDAGGTHLVYLPSVDPAQSIALLQASAEQSKNNHLRDTAVFAISMHQSAATVPALTALAAPQQDLALRDRAAFWLSTQHGAEALPVLERFAQNDQDDRFREKLTFDLTLVHQPAAAAILSRMAHQDSAPGVRRQAQFWMAELGGRQVAAELRDSANNDPAEEVRKSAVFGLSRLPNGEGTTRLIELAQTGRDPEVRKQALFWLGQSSDPRALDYLTKLIQQ